MIQKLVIEIAKYLQMRLNAISDFSEKGWNGKMMKTKHLKYQRKEEE